jgi:hypothetical protein
VIEMSKTVKVDREWVLVRASAKEEVERAALNAHLTLGEYISRYYYGLVAERRIIPNYNPLSEAEQVTIETTEELRIKALIEGWKKT